MTDLTTSQNNINPAPAPQPTGNGGTAVGIVLLLLFAVVVFFTLGWRHWRRGRRARDAAGISSSGPGPGDPAGGVELSDVNGRCMQKGMFLFFFFLSFPLMSYPVSNFTLPFVMTILRGSEMFMLGNDNVGMALSCSGCQSCVTPIPTDQTTEVDTRLSISNIKIPPALDFSPISVFHHLFFPDCPRSSNTPFTLSQLTFHPKFTPLPDERKANTDT